MGKEFAFRDDMLIQTGNTIQLGGLSEGDWQREYEATAWKPD